MQKVFELFNATAWGAAVVSLGSSISAVIAGLIFYWLIFRVLFRFAARSDTWLDQVLVKRWRGPAFFLLPLIMLMLMTPSLTLPPKMLMVLRNGFSLVFTASLTWLLINTVFVLKDMILRHYDLQVKNNLKARVIHTQVNVLVKIALVIISTVAVASMLMTFEKMRQLGLSILASAGIIGIIAGFAAQRSIATLFAGIQIALTQPIRIDDVVIVEGEWGWIEELTLTYVVVRIWDWRRLIIPIHYFLEKPFQNWTRRSAAILGTVFLYVDYTIPVDDIRREFHRILQASSLWDQNVWNVQVTNTTERAMEVRCLMSAVDAPTAWDLRCEVREKLIDFIRQNYPDAFPKVRAKFSKTSRRSEK
jgi:small-conductance mechanosensitive channel